MKLLDAVNNILPKLGEHTVTTLDVKHSTLAVLLPEIDRQSRDLQMRGWWFNTWVRTLYPDTAGRIALPDNTLSFVPDRANPAVPRGGYLLTPEGTDTWTIPSIVGTLVDFVEFDALPEAVAAWVFYNALVVMYTTDIGVEQELRVWQQLAERAEHAMLSEHLQNKRYSTSSSPRYWRYRRALRG